MSAFLLVALIASTPLDLDATFLVARDQYRQLNFEQATIRFQEAAILPERTAEERAHLYGWIGLCYAQLDDVSGARRWFGEAVSLHAEVQLADEAPPKIKELLERVRAERFGMTSGPGNAEVLAPSLMSLRYFEVVTAFEVESRP